MDATLLVIGKTSNSHISACVDDYCCRLRRYLPFSIKTLPDVRNARKLTEAQQKEVEADLILQQITSADCVVLLDEHGREFSSMEFATYMQKKMGSGLKRLIFVVGGPYGFSPRVYDRANEKISLSRMTFNHEMIRLFFTEQVYRAMTILRGEPYHHE